MKARLLLAAAIIAEVGATLALRASVDHAAWFIAVVAGYVAAFTLLGLTLRAGMAIGAVYGIWGACGVCLVAVLGILVFNETLSGTALAGIGLIVVGVLLIETDPRRSESGVAEEVGL